MYRLSKYCPAGLLSWLSRWSITLKDEYTLYTEEEEEEEEEEEFYIFSLCTKKEEFFLFNGHLQKFKFRAQRRKLFRRKCYSEDVC